MTFYPDDIETIRAIVREEIALDEAKRVAGVPLPAPCARCGSSERAEAGAPPMAPASTPQRRRGAWKPIDTAPDWYRVRVGHEHDPMSMRLHGGLPQYGYKNGLTGKWSTCQLFLTGGGSICHEPTHWLDEDIVETFAA